MRARETLWPDWSCARASAAGAGAIGRPALKAALAAGLVVALLAGDAAAQSREPSRTGAPAAGDDSRGRRVAGEPDFMLLAARRQLSEGKVLEARRMLEQIIERFSDDPAADEARRTLAPIYAADARGGPRAPAGAEAFPGPAGRASPPAPRPVDGVRDAAAHRAAQPKDAGNGRWRDETRQLRALEQDFRGSVGDRVFFGDGNVVVGAKSGVVLAGQADWLKRHPAIAVVVEGHADDRGSREQNEELSARRAEAVRARLIEEGVEAERIRVRAHGRDSQVAPCPESGCAAQNRRVVTRIGEPEPSRAGIERGRRY